MKRIIKLILLLILSAATAFNCSEPSGQSGNNKKLQVLILSGRNNHNWKETTPVLKNIFENSGLFEVEITNSPDTLTYKTIKEYDVIANNWNSWPEKDFRWEKEVEEGLLKFLQEGGGLVFFHASTTAFYNWPEFKKISTGAWVDDTWHGKIAPAKVFIENHDHPITKGIADFFILDELWLDAEKNEDFEVLGSAINEDAKEKGYSKQPAILVSQYGKGRIFHMLPGHDARAMRNSGFKTLIIRAAEWAATSKVTYPVPDELKVVSPDESNKYAWIKSDTTFALLKNDRVIWQYNFNNYYGKPYFHPVFVNRNRITCLSPDDHPWHNGQWFSWKFINGLNYWEYIRGTYKSEGITDIKNIETIKNSDHSARIVLNIEYHPPASETVLKEKRIIKISPPQKDGRIWMDYDMTFEAIADEVLLDRTPIMGEPDGKSWGGYSGLSIRFNQDFMESIIISDQPLDSAATVVKGEWMYMGFKGTDGKQTGSLMISPKENQNESQAWYIIDNNNLPFYYFSPAYIFYNPVTLKKGEKINLKYRVLHFEGEITRENLEAEAAAFSS